MRTAVDDLSVQQEELGHLREASLMAQEDMNAHIEDIVVSVPRQSPACVPPQPSTVGSESVAMTACTVRYEIACALRTNGASQRRPVVLQLFSFSCEYCSASSRGCQLSFGAECPRLVPLDVHHCPRLGLTAFSCYICTPVYIDFTPGYKLCS